MPLKKRIIPCLDIDNGKVVKGVNFENIKIVGDPIELCMHYISEGADELAVLDITASSQNRDSIFDLISKIAQKCRVPFCVGGGIRDLDSAKKAITCGADKVSIGTAAVLQPQIITQIARVFGSQACVVSLDVKKVNEQYKIFTKGGRENSCLDAIDFAKQIEAIGAGEILLNSIDADGSRGGYNNELNFLISKAVKIPVIASGGAGKIEHFLEAVTKGGASAVLAASVFHLKEISINQVKTFMQKNGVAVRMI